MYNQNWIHPYVRCSVAHEAEKDYLDLMACGAHRASALETYSGQAAHF